jgi:hypothetical protein
VSVSSGITGAAPRPRSRRLLEQLGHAEPDGHRGPDHPPGGEGAGDADRLELGEEAVGLALHHRALIGPGASRGLEAPLDLAGAVVDRPVERQRDLGVCFEVSEQGGRGPGVDEHGQVDAVSVDPHGPGPSAVRVQRAVARPDSDRDAGLEIGRKFGGNRRARAHSRGLRRSLGKV